MIVGVLRMDLHLPDSLSLKDKRSVLKSVKDQLRGRFNVAVAEVDTNEKWQRASVGIVTLGDDRRYVEGCLSHVLEWMRAHRSIALIHVEQELL
jgi:uncharacterized protein YlxP (DUF503 family)